MKLQTKIFILLSVTIGIILCSFLAYQFISFKEKKLISVANATNHGNVIDKIMKLKGERFEQTTKDNSGWDDMIVFAQKPDSNWAVANVDYMVTSFKMSFTLVYNIDKQLVYSFYDTAAIKQPLRFSSEQITTSFSKSPYCHFFHYFGDELYEIFGAIIVPASDVETRKTPPQGYLLVAKHWNNDYFKELETATDFAVEISSKSDIYLKNKIQNPDKLYFNRSLTDFAGNVIATVQFSSEDGINKELKSFFYWSLLIFGITFITILGFLYYFRKIILQPIGKITVALHTDSVTPLESLHSKTEEFVLMSTLIIQFFQQKVELREKIEELLATEEELKQNNEELLTLTEVIEEKEERLRTLIENQGEGFVILNISNQFEFANPAAHEILGLPEDSLVGKSIQELFDKEQLQIIRENTELRFQGKKSSYELDLSSQAKCEKWIQVTGTPDYDKKNNHIGTIAVFRDITGLKIAEQQLKNAYSELQNYFETLQNQKQTIEAAHLKITDSINYALRIQQALLPNEEVLNGLIPKNFILFHPRDVVSGDFYFVREVNQHLIILAADCTGHGIPGAFMSLLSFNFIYEITQQMEGLFMMKPNEILEDLRSKIKEVLPQTQKVRDGMDAALVCIEKKTNKLQYAGANNPIYIIMPEQIDYELVDNKVIQIEIENAQSTGCLIEMKPDKQPVGVYMNETPYTNHTLQLQPDSIVYMFSDGFVDQFGGEIGRKYRSQRLKSFLFSIHNKPMNEQKQALELELTEWKGNCEQVDDILVMGLKI